MTAKIFFFIGRKKRGKIVCAWPKTAIDQDSLRYHAYANMVVRIRNDSWKEDIHLKESLTKHIKEGLRREEVLDFMTRDFADHAWSLRTLDRRLRYFEISFTDRSAIVDQEEAAVKHEMEGPRKLLGYRAMYKKLRQVHDLCVLRDLVHAVMYNVDPAALEERTPQFKQKKQKGHFMSKGTDWVHSLDGHDKLMGYQNSTFPLAVYACIDTCSRKVLWAKVWTCKSDPSVIGRFFLEYLFKNKTIASMLRWIKEQKLE